MRDDGTQLIVQLHFYNYCSTSNTAILLDFITQPEYSRRSRYLSTRLPNTITTITSPITTTDHLVWITDYNASTYYIEPDRTWTGGPRTIKCLLWSMDSKCQIAVQLVANGWARMWAMCVRESTTSVHLKRVLLPSNYGRPLGFCNVRWFRRKVKPPFSEWLSCSSCILTWYWGHQPAINLIKVHTAHVSFPCSVYPYLYTKHITRLVIWKLCNNSQDCAYTNRFSVSAEDVLVIISKSCTTCSNMALGGEMRATLCPYIMYWHLPYN